METRNVKRKLEDQLSEANEAEREEEKKWRIEKELNEIGMPESMNLFMEARSFILNDECEKMIEEKMDPTLYKKMQYSEKNVVLFLNCFIPRLRDDLDIFKRRVNQQDGDKIFLHYIQLMIFKLFKTGDSTNLKSKYTGNALEFKLYMENVNKAVFTALSNVGSYDFDKNAVFCMYCNQFVNQLIYIWYGGDVHSVTYDKTNKMVSERSSEIVLETYDSIVNRGKTIIEDAEKKAEDIILHARMEARRILEKAEASEDEYFDGNAQMMDWDIQTQETPVEVSETDDKKESDKAEVEHIFDSDDNDEDAPKHTLRSALVPELKFGPIGTRSVVNTDSESDSESDSEFEAKPEAKPAVNTDSESESEPEADPEAKPEKMSMEMLTKKVQDIEFKFCDTLQNYSDHFQRGATVFDLSQVTMELGSVMKIIRYCEGMESLVSFADLKAHRPYFPNQMALWAMKDTGYVKNLFLNHDNPMYIHGVGSKPNMYGNFFLCKEFFLSRKNDEDTFYRNTLNWLDEYAKENLDDADFADIETIRRRSLIQMTDFAVYFKDGNLLMKFIVDIIGFIEKLPKSMPPDGNILNSFTYEWNMFIELLCSCRFNPKNYFFNDKNTKMILKVTLDKNREFFDWEALDSNARTSIRGIVQEIADFSVKDIEKVGNVMQVGGDTLDHIQSGFLLHNMKMITLGQFKEDFDMLDHNQLRQTVLLDEYKFKIIMSAFLYALPFFKINDDWDKEDVDLLLDNVVRIFMFMTTMDLS